MTETEYLLTCLAEECAEVIQAITKALRFGLDNGADHYDGKTNADMITAELADVFALYHITARQRCVINCIMESAVNAKVEKVFKTMPKQLQR